MQKGKIAAIVLAGGSGKRMGGSCKKQYLLLDEKPILYYSLKAFQDSPYIDVIILVTNEPEYCMEELVLKYHMDKVIKAVPGGKERYHSVYNGLQAVEQKSVCDYVLIHDGARPFVTGDIIKRSVECVEQYQACVVGMPVKDTIKIADEMEFAKATPDRKCVWMIQTPQTFSFALIKNAYEQILKDTPEGITDDAMVIESQNLAKVKLIPGSYENIKITTPEDMEIAEVFLNKQKCLEK
ncbi:MAG: 2-C-methyl-D-erythritol 4-phosphate cytidylyltransferase [Lachnospiraceae bacterium]|nr:2-C-methyl-D-erythritol 4-phosphate cytidylyltransferase [Lachnospiraceae bacterium]